MTLTIENETGSIYQATQHGMLVAWGRFARHLRLAERLRTAVAIRRQRNANPGGDLILQFGLASLAGYEYLADLNLGPQPLVGDQAVADAWNIRFGHYTTVSRFLYEVDTATAESVQDELAALMQPFLRRAVQEVLRHQEWLTLCGDLTGRPVSAYSQTYPPDTVFGHMANRLRKGHQAALVTLKGRDHRVHVTASHLPGNTVSGPCLPAMVVASEAQLGCRPRRRTELVRQRIGAIEAKMAHKQGWCERQQTILRQQVERQVRLGSQLQALKPKLADLEARYAAKVVRPHSQLAQAQQQKASWERQLQSALAQEVQARRVLARHQRHLAELTSQREQLLNWLAQLEVDNATNPNPVPMRWLLDGGFGDAGNITYLIEMGYDFFTIAHNGATTGALLKEVPPQACWQQAGVRTQALDMATDQVSDCPYPLRLTLLRWREGDTYHYSTLVSFSTLEALPTADLFPAYHQRQDVEAGIKQGKGTFSFTKLRVRSPAGIRLLGQFALVFWPNFVHWAAEWLRHQVRDEANRFSPVLQQVRPQVRVAANTAATVLTAAQGQLLLFDANGPFADVQIWLDRPFAYQLPLALFQAGQLPWPVSSSSVKEQLAILTASSNKCSLATTPAPSPNGSLPEKVPKILLFERLHY